MDINKRIDQFLEDTNSEITEEVEGDFSLQLSDLMESVFTLIDSFEEDGLDEDQEELIEEILAIYDGETDEILDEAKKQIKRVVRAGKRVRKVVCGKGYKAVSGKCVKMGASEKRVRSKSAKKAAKKKRGKQSSINRKRKKSMKKRI